MKTNEYKCAECGGVFEKGWSDDEAEKEALEKWGVMRTQEMCVICDDCFNKMFKS